MVAEFHEEEVHGQEPVELEVSDENHGRRCIERATMSTV